MISPFTGGNATLRHEKSELTFRKEKFQYVHQFYECDETKERFTTTELDDVNIAQVYNQYRAKYGIPFPDEIKRIRQRYGLSASKMSQILGFGDNQYRLYENGDIPSETNGKILMSIQNPQIFENFVVNAKNQFGDNEFAKILNKVKSAKCDDNSEIAKSYIFSGNRRDIFNGYATQSIPKLKNIILFFIEKFNGVFFTMMNKLLFYSDFYSYKTTGRGMSGLAYKAILRGPVPVRWDRIYSSFDDIQPEIVHFDTGIEGTRLVSNISPDLAEITDAELNILATIYQRFKTDNSTKISDISHTETALQKYVDSGQMISFDMAFSLKAV